MNPIHNLSDDNRDQLIRYLHFFRTKKDSALRSLGNEFEDAKSDRLNEDMFSREDMADFADALEAHTKSHVSHDISAFINMSALAITELLESAEEQGVSLTLDTTSLENQSLIDSIERMSLDILPSNRKRSTVGLVSLKDEAKALQNESKAVRDEAERLGESNKTLQHRFSVVQTDASNLAREKAALQSEVADLKRRLAQAERANQDRESDMKGSCDSNSSLLSKIRRLEEDLEEERDANQRRVADTPQFQQMRKMMNSQNQKLRDLRRRLEQYEPDNSKDDYEDT